MILGYEEEDKRVLDHIEGEYVIIETTFKVETLGAVTQLPAQYMLISMEQILYDFEFISEINFSAHEGITIKTIDSFKK